MQQYFREIRNLNPLSPEEETEIALKAQAGDEAAKEKLVVHNLRYVVSVAREHLGRGLELQELVAVGNMGLFKALEKYDPLKERKFITYARFYIVQQIQYAIHGQHLVWTPVNQMLANRKTEAARQESLQNDDDVSEVPLEDRNQAHARMAMRPAARFDQPMISDRDGRTLSEVLADPFDYNGQQMLEAQDRAGMVKNMLVKLKPMEQEVIKCFFGIDSPVLEPEEIAEKIKLTTTRVHQLKRTALHKLKTLFGK